MGSIMIRCNDDGDHSWFINGDKGEGECERVVGAGIVDSVNRDEIAHSLYGLKACEERWIK